MVEVKEVNMPRAKIGSVIVSLSRSNVAVFNKSGTLFQKYSGIFRQKYGVIWVACKEYRTEVSFFYGEKKISYGEFIGMAEEEVLRKD